MQREVVLDTETTGLDPDGGHRVVEVAALELVNHLPTGRTFHSYVNPQRDMPEDAFRVHGLSAEFLREYPVFAEVVVTRSSSSRSMEPDELATLTAMLRRVEGIGVVATTLISSSDVDCWAPVGTPCAQTALPISARSYRSSHFPSRGSFSRARHLCCLSTRATTAG